MRAVSPDRASIISRWFVGTVNDINTGRADRCALLRALAPDADFVETSIRVSDECTSARATHYFDGDRGHAARGNQALIEAAETLQIALPIGFAEFLSAEPPPGLWQAAVGVDDSSAPWRLKYYAVLSGPNAPKAAKAVLRAVGVATPTRRLWSAIHIVGVDLSSDGVHDVKLYWSLDPRNLSRTLRSPRAWLPLVRNCRAAILQESLIQPRGRRVHIEVEDPSALLRFLLVRFSRCAGVSGLQSLLSRLREERRPSTPRLVAMDYEDGRIRPDNFTLYLHP